MTPEHKQQAKQLIADWTNVSRTSTPAVWFLNADCMAGFLQELINAPEPEPVFTLTVSESGKLMVWATHTYTGQIPSGEHLLYLAPPAPSVPDWMNYKQGYTDGIIEVRNDLKQLCKDFSCRQDRPYMGDVHAQIDALCDRAIAECSTKSDSPTPAESPADVALDAARWRMLPAFLEEFEISYLRLEDAIDAAMSEKGGA